MPRFVFFHGLCAAVFAGLPLLTSPAMADDNQPSKPAERLDRQNLLEFRDDQGEVVPVRSLPDWRKRRAEILTGVQEVMGPLPGQEKRVPLDIQVEEEKDFGTYVRRRITYAAEPGSRVPAHLFIPKDVLDSPDPSPRRAVLCLMGTGGHRHADTPDGPDSGNNVHDGEALAARGFVAISPAYPSLGFGIRSGIDIPYDPDLKALGYVSGTMKAIWDNVRALDVLESLPYVRRGGFAVIGHSLGGHNGIYTAVWDDRIRVVAASCSFDSYLDYYPNRWEPGKGWAQDRYMPNILNYPRELIPFDFHELLGSLAPRAVFVNAPVHDANFQWRSAAKVVAAAMPIYRLHGVPDLIQIVHPDAAHDFPAEIREDAYAWIEQYL